MQNNLEAALAYAEKFNFSVIPIRPENKHPYIQWGEHQKRRATADEIKAWWKQWPKAMIGIVTGEISGIFVVDCDTAAGYESVQKLIPDNLLFPVERTPRGGWHLFFKWFKDYQLTVGAKVLPGVDFRSDGGCIVVAPSINAEGKRYAWVEGLAIGELEMPPAPCALLSALNNNKVHYKEECNADQTAADKLFTNGRRDNDLFRTANFLVKGGMPAEEIAQVLERLILSWGEKPDAKWIDAKIKSAIDRANQREGSLAQDIREWVLSSSGVFTSSDMAKELGLSSRVVMQNTSKVLTRLCEGASPLIERYGSKRGCYRRLENDVEPLDWQNAETNPLNLIWPFGIHNLVHVFPGNIGVIAGYPNAGKTAFIHNFIRFNQQQHEVHLFSSEGGPEELKMRLSKFDCPLSEWKFKAWERSGDFADVIKPDAVNIIDYLEIHDDFYKVGGMIKAISDKLKNGFALIAIQKNSGRDEGLGGARGLEKPRLYMAMDSGRLKIVKAKSWVDSHNNPNGQSVRFKIVDGCKFIIESKWEK